ncbi:MAG: phosphoesterase [Planctomycetaceae bacterium]|nr:phosphoesterase [Planctomycetaceae bacterium]
MTATSQSVEHVLVVPTSLFHDIGHFQGFSEDAEQYLGTLLDPAYTSYRPRDAVEEDPSFKQLIPYCIFRFEDQIFTYTRGNDQGEARLHAKRSIGIGGHISTMDRDAGSPYDEGMWREISEEIHLEAEYTQTCVGMINDDETDVGKVHLGVVHIFELEAPKVRPREKSMIDAGFTQVTELVRDHQQFETWSQICIKHLFSSS